jgi:DNA end-binding protein Ku
LVVPWTNPSTGTGPRYDFDETTKAALDNRPSRALSTANGHGVVISRRERMVLLEPLGKGIMATVLRYPYEVRGEDAYFEDIPDLKLPGEMLDLAAHIIEQKSADFEPAAFEDRYENALVELLKSKEAGKPIVAPEAPRPTNVVNLMDALRKSIESEKPVASKKAPSKTSAARSSGKGAKATKAG